MATLVNAILHNINRMLKERDKSQDWLADATGIARPQLNKYLSGRVALPIRYLEKIAAALKVGVEVLLSSPPPPDSPPRKPTSAELLAEIIQRWDIEEEKKAALLLLLTDDADLYETLMAGIRPHLPPASNKHKLPKAR